MLKKILPYLSLLLLVINGGCKDETNYKTANYKQDITPYGKVLTVNKANIDGKTQSINLTVDQQYFVETPFIIKSIDDKKVAEKYGLLIDYSVDKDIHTLNVTGGTGSTAYALPIPVLDRIILQQNFEIKDKKLILNFKGINGIGGIDLFGLYRSLAYRSKSNELVIAFYIKYPENFKTSKQYKENVHKFATHPDTFPDKDIHGRLIKFIYKIPNSVNVDELLEYCRKKKK